MSERIAEIRHEGSKRTRFGAKQKMVGLECPFCQCVTEAYVWSLAGSGKLCDCGAKLVFQLGGYWAQRA